LQLRLHQLMRQAKYRGLRFRCVDERAIAGPPTGEFGLRLGVIVQFGSQKPLARPG